MDVTEDRILAPKGFRAAGVACGLKPEGKDVAVIASDCVASAAGMFTTNRVSAAPLQVNREHLRDGRARAIVANAKNANACTGERGLSDARRSARVAADPLGASPADILVNSTGVIGVPLPMDTLEAGIGAAIAELRVDGWDDAALAIMTTDTVPKRASVRMALGGNEVTVCGIAKGAGMIAPNMATMLCFVATDASVAPEPLASGLRSAVDRSFNCVTVDGDMSTNDTVLLLANGASGGASLEGADLAAFQEGLSAVCESLARQVARDGEGATKLIAIRVCGADTDADARTVGLSVANSNLVKTAVHGRDPNWGRILCAIGYAGVRIDPSRVAVSMAGIPIYGGGAGLEFDHQAAVTSLSADVVPIDIDLGAGGREITVYTCDLTAEYVKINAEYTT